MVCPFKCIRSMTSRPLYVPFKGRCLTILPWVFFFYPGVLTAWLSIILKSYDSTMVSYNWKYRVSETKWNPVLHDLCLNKRAALTNRKGAVLAWQLARLRCESWYHSSSYRWVGFSSTKVWTTGTMMLHDLGVPLQTDNSQELLSNTCKGGHQQAVHHIDS